MSTSKPTILLVPGSFAAGNVYAPLVSLFRAQGFSALAAQLPSSQKRYPLPPATLQDDAAHVRGIVEQLLAEEESRQVVVVAHSYGGTVATEAFEGLGTHGEGKGGVRRLVFLTATAPRVGETLNTALRQREDLLPKVTDGYMHMDPVAFAPFLCNDLPYAQAYEHALNFPHHSAVSFKTEVTAVSYRHIPSTYIFCERDLVISPEAQQRFIDTIEEVSGRKVDVRRLDAGHCPNFSKERELVEIIAQAAEL